MTTTRPTYDDGPPIALPTVRLLAVSGGSALVAGGIWALIGVLTGAVPYMLGIWSGLMVAAVMIASVFAMTPWKPRPVPWIMTMWLGSTVLRFFITPILAWVLYSATQFSAASLALVVGTTYIVSLFSEVIVLAVAVRQMETATLADRTDSDDDKDDARS